MPEAPDLVVIRELLAERVVGKVVKSSRVLRPSVVRSLAGNLEDDVAGRRFDAAERRGKWLLLRLSAGASWPSTRC